MLQPKTTPGFYLSFEIAFKPITEVIPNSTSIVMFSKVELAITFIGRPFLSP